LAQRFQSKVSWLHCFGPKVRYSIMATGLWNVCLVAARKQKGRWRDWGQSLAFKDMPPVTYFLQLGPTS
jgi:hypothetical protein